MLFLSKWDLYHDNVYTVSRSINLEKKNARFNNNFVIIITNMIISILSAMMSLVSSQP